MRRLLVLLAVSTILGVPASALAQGTVTAGSVLGNQNDKDGSGTFRGGLLNGNIVRFGTPDKKGEIGPPRVGFKGEGSLAAGGVKGKFLGGDCDATAALGQVAFDASIGIGAEKDATKGANMKYSTPSSGGGVPGKGGGGKGLGGVVQCGIGVEANVVSIEASCQFAFGTIKPSIKGPGVAAGCSCSRGCVAEAYWAKAGIEYETPQFGGCGLEVAVTAGAEVMAGVAAGVEKVGDVGAGIKLGPVGVKAGVSIKEFDTGKMAECAKKLAENLANAVVDAAEFYRDAGVAAYNLGKDALNNAIDGGKELVADALNAGQDLVGGALDAGKSLAKGIGGFFGFGKKDPPRVIASAPSSAPGSNVGRAARTVADALGTGQIPPRGGPSGPGVGTTR